MTVAVKLDSCTFYVKIRIWPFLDRIIPSLFKMIHPWITNKLNGQFPSLILKPLEFFSCQQLWMKVAAVLFCISSLQPFFSSLAETCWALNAPSIALACSIFLHCWAHIQSMALERAYATNVHLLYISTSQRTHKRNKIINFILKGSNIYHVYLFSWEVSTRAKLLWVGCHIWDQLACNFRCFFYQYPSTCHINDTMISRHQSFM